MQNVEANISNTKRPLYDGIQPENICYQVFDDDIDDDDVVLPYGQRIKDKNTEEVDQAYVENLEKNIQTHIVVPGKDSFPVLTKFRGKKRHHSSNLVGDPNKNPILNTRIYQLDFIDCCVEEYLVNTILKTLLEQVNSNEWETVLISETDPNVSIQK